MTAKLPLPPEMEADRETLEKTRKTIIRLKAQEIEKPLSVYSSKLGGIPYFPLREQYPCNKDGKPLYLIAQINFAEIFQNTEIAKQILDDAYLKHLPETGILSFFIDYYDDCLGCNFGDTNQPSSYKIIYFPEIEKDESLLMNDFSFLQSDNDSSFMPMLEDGDEYAFALSLEEQFVSLESYEWEKFMGKHAYDYLDTLAYPEGRDDGDIFEEYNGTHSGGHQIGGYPFFTQEDPRTYEESLRSYDFLLLQLDSDDYIMWGDCGVANFFINFEKLKQRDFSDILYNWDCC